MAITGKIWARIDLSTYTSFSKFWSILTELITGKKTAVIGEKSTVNFATGLLTTLYRLSLFLSWLERKPAKLSCERKTIKWATKLAIKGKTKGKRKERAKKNRNKIAK